MNAWRIALFYEENLRLYHPLLFIEETLGRKRHKLVLFTT